MNISPLRYPGGKAKIVPMIREIIRNNFEERPVYIEPFAGGAGVALSLLMNGVVKEVVINDFDAAVYSFWDNVLNHTERFAEAIEKIDVSISQWYEQRQIYMNAAEVSFELGLAAFFLNRTNHSGILTGGPIGGYEQKGKWKLDCRFNKADLICRIRKIAEFQKKIRIFNKDIFQFIRENLSKYRKPETFIYFDPPYYVKGDRLYKNFFEPEDHCRLEKQIREKLKCPWIVTYDNVKEIREIYSRNLNKEISIHYSAGMKTTGKEVLFYSPGLDITGVKFA